MCLRGQGEWGVYTSMHACMHPCKDPLHLSLSSSLSLSLHLSCIHRSISFGNEVWRERGRGAGYMGGKRNKFSPPTLKMHIHFHTLKRQWGAHTLAAVSPICIPPVIGTHTHTGTHTPPKTPNTAKMNVCVPFSGCGWKSTPCHIYLHKSRRCMCVCLYTYWLCAWSLCVCFCVSVCT